MLIPDIAIGCAPGSEWAGRRRTSVLPAFPVALEVSPAQASIITETSGGKSGMPRKMDSVVITTQFCARLNRLQPHSRARWGKMNSHQMVCHLVDTFRAVAGEKPVSSVVNLFGRTLLRWGALHIPVPWLHGIPTRPEIAQGVGGTPPALWADDVAELHRRITEFPRLEQFEQHPMMGTLSLDEWRIWGYRHVDHHFRQFGL